MFQIIHDKSKQLVMLSFSQRVEADEMKRCLRSAQKVVADIAPGFRVLTDLTNLEFMNASCAVYIGKLMDLWTTNGVTEVVRIIPDPHKDIGFALLSIFHFGKQINVRTFETMEAAVQSLVT